LKNSIVIGTRGSDLALWQAHFVKSRLEALGHTCSIHIIKTQGDQIQHLSLSKLEGKGFFTKEIEEALLKKEIDVAVHSHKDLETQQPEGLVVAAVSHREDPRDVLLVHPSARASSEPFGLKKHARVGTSSARRKAQMLHFRPDVELVDIRGNVPSRIEKLRSGAYDAILLAGAGIQRLKLNVEDLQPTWLHPEDFVPAPAQGVLAIQCREADTALRSILENIHHADVQEVIHIERSVLNRMNGGCQLPLGVFATKNNDNEFEVHVAMAAAYNAPTRHYFYLSNDAETLITRIVNDLMAE
jgi:hydroxymethylbilane synthase